MTVAERTPPDGGWVVDEVSYVDPVRAFCDLCGRPLTRRYWRVERAGRVLRYCEPAHAGMDIAARGSDTENADRS